MLAASAGRAGAAIALPLEHVLEDAGLDHQPARAGRHQQRDQLWSEVHVILVAPAGMPKPVGLLGLFACVRVRLEVRLATALVGDVNVHLGGCEIGVAEHLLDAA